MKKLNKKQLLNGLMVLVVTFVFAACSSTKNNVKSDEASVSGFDNGTEMSQNSADLGGASSGRGR